MKPTLPWIRRGQRVIRMVTELHRLGYQCLRVMPYMYPLAYRVAVAPRSVFSALNGAYADGEFELIASHSCAGDANDYFDWRDSKTDNASQLASKFLARFPRIAAQGRGRDWAYAGWLIELMGRIERENLVPVVHWEHMSESPEALRFLPLWRFDEWGNSEPNADRFPLPPAPI